MSHIAYFRSFCCVVKSMLCVLMCMFCVSAFADGSYVFNYKCSNDENAQTVYTQALPTSGFFNIPHENECTAPPNQVMDYWDCGDNLHFAPGNTGHALSLGSVQADTDCIAHYTTEQIRIIYNYDNGEMCEEEMFQFDVSPQSCSNFGIKQACTPVDCEVGGNVVLPNANMSSIDTGRDSTGCPSKDIEKYGYFLDGWKNTSGQFVGNINTQISCDKTLLGASERQEGEYFSTAILSGNWEPVCLGNTDCPSGTFLEAKTVACDACLDGYWCPGATNEHPFCFDEDNNQGLESCKTLMNNQSAQSNGNRSSNTDCYIPCDSSVFLPDTTEVHYVEGTNNYSCSYNLSISYLDTDWGYVGNCRTSSYNLSDVSGTVDLCLPGDDLSNIKTGYTFLGWRNGNNTYSASSLQNIPVSNLSLAYSISSNIVRMFASWSPILYTITYNTNGGTLSADNPGSYNIETRTFDLPTPTKTGYTFAGWYNNADFAGDQVTQVEKGSHENMILYAKWVYNVVYNPNNETGNSTIDSNVSGVPYTINNTLTLDNYDFVGWCVGTTTCDNPVQNGLVVCDTDNCANDDNITYVVPDNNAQILLYAQWDANEYEIKFYPNNGNQNPVATVYEKYATQWQSALSPDGVVVNNIDVIPTKERNVFGGYWSVSGNTGGDQITDLDGYFIQNSETIYTDNGNAYARFYDCAPDGFVDTIDPDGDKHINSVTASVSSDNKCRYTVACDNGYTVVGQYASVNISAPGVVGTANDFNSNTCSKDTYNIVYAPNGGTMPNNENTGTYTITDTLGEDGFVLTSPSNRTGYDFVGWCVYNEETENGANCGEVITSLPQNTTGNKWAYAKWQINNIVCAAGKYLPRNKDNSTDCAPCLAYGYCPGSDALGYSNGFLFSATNDQGLSDCTDLMNNNFATTKGTDRQSPQDCHIMCVSYNGFLPGQETISYNADLGENYVYSCAYPVTIEYKMSNENDADTVSGCGTTNYDRIADNTVNLCIPESAVNNGYNFVGWTNGENSYLMEDNEGLSNISVADFERNSDVLDSNIVTMIAIWEADEYTITYNPNGGTLTGGNTRTYTIEDTADASGLNLVLPVNRTGYDFVGWCVYNEETENGANCGEAIKKLPQNTTGNKWAYAKWVAMKYNVSFSACSDDATGAKSDLTNISYEDNTKLPDGTGFARNGYHFTGWYCSDDENNSAACKTDTVFNVGANTDTIINSDVLQSLENVQTFILCAKWEPTEYRIDYTGLTGANLSSANPTAYNITTGTILLNNPTKSGYTFAGWCDSDDDNCTPSTNFTFNPANQQVLKNKNFVARWDINTYKICYRDSAQLGNSDTCENEYADIGLTPTTYTILNPVRYPTPSRPADTTTYQEDLGWVFGGWYSNPELTTGAGTGFNSGQTGDKIVYAKWVPQQGQIDFVCSANKTVHRSGQVGITTSVPTSANDSNNCGAEIDGWVCSGSNGSYNGNTVTFAANKITCRSGYKITYVDYYGYGESCERESGCDYVSGYSSDYTILFPTKSYMNTNNIYPGHTFYGWFFNPDLIHNESATLARGAYGNKTVYAKWLPSEYSVKYKCTDNGNIVYSDSATYNSPYPVHVNDLCSKTGYEYDSWQCNTDYTLNANAQIDFDMTSDLVCLPKWQPVKYNVSFEKCAGLDTNVSGSVSDINDVAYDTETDVAPAGYTRTGYTFDGWCYGDDIDLLDDTNPNCKENPQRLLSPGDALSELSDTSDNVVLCAKWSLDTYTIEYNYDGGILNENVTNPETYTVLSDTITMNNPTKTGYVFDGWCAGTEICDNPVLTMQIQQGSVGNKVYRAKWTPIEYTITFNSGGGVGEMTDMVLKYDQEQDLAENIFELDDYDFAGWCDSWDDEDGVCKSTAITYSDKQSVINLSNNNDDVITLTALWQPHGYDIYYYSDDDMLDLTPSTYTVEQMPVDLPVLDKDGYSFLGWCVVNAEAENGANCENPKITLNQPEDLSGNKWLYAKWAVKCEPKTYLPADKTSPDDCKPCENGWYCPGGYYVFNDLVDQGKTKCPDDYPKSTAESDDITSCYHDCVGRAYYDVFGGVYCADDLCSEEIDMCEYNFICESDKWLHVGKNNKDKMCLYHDKPTGLHLGIRVGSEQYYMKLLNDKDITINNESNKKLRVRYKGKTYNAYDNSNIDVY